MEDLNQLKEPILFQGIEVFDVIRFFKGDGPAYLFEPGKQKCGHCLCWMCNIHSSVISDYAQASYIKNLTLQDRQNIVLKTRISRERSKQGITKLYNKLQKADVVEELHERNVAYRIDSNIDELRDKLIKEMCGIQRVPSLLFNQPDTDISSTELRSYEILGCEPLHDIGNHIKNLFFEIPHHFEDVVKIRSLIEATFNDKDSRRCVDYRSSLIKVYIFCKQNYPEHPVTSILFTLCEIQRVLYEDESKRTNESILHLYLQTFLHVILLKTHFEKNLKSTTKRKFFGKYIHTIMSHASHQIRTLNGQSSNTENEERFFSTIKSNARLTSNHHPDNVISNAFIRSQVRKAFVGDESMILQEQGVITKLYKPISLKLENSVVSFQIIETYPWEYQALLEKIADFLQEGNFWKETDVGVQFNDMISVNSKKSVHHFRSSDVCNELKIVQDCWTNVCQENADSLIPAFKIKIEDEVGGISIRYLKTLTHFSANISDENIIENSVLQPINDMHRIEDISLENASLSRIESTNIFPRFINSTPKPHKVNASNSSDENTMKNSNSEATNDMHQIEDIVELVELNQMTFFLELLLQKR